MNLSSATILPDILSILISLIPLFIFMFIFGFLVAILFFTALYPISLKKRFDNIQFSVAFCIILLMVIGYIYLDETHDLSVWVSLGITLVLVFITAQYASSTKQLGEISKKQIDVSVEQMKISRQIMKTQTQPLVHVFISPGEKYISDIWMIIENIGGAPAFNIKLKAIGDIPTPSGSLTTEYDIFKKGISYLAPSKRIQFILTELSDNYPQKRELSLKIEVNWENDLNENFHQVYPIELFIFHGFRIRTDDKPQG